MSSSNRSANTSVLPLSGATKYRAFIHSSAAFDDDVGGLLDVRADDGCGIMLTVTLRLQSSELEAASTVFGLFSCTGHAAASGQIVSTVVPSALAIAVISSGVGSTRFFSSRKIRCSYDPTRCASSACDTPARARSSRK